jgi:hypothetical protein
VTSDVIMTAAAAVLSYAATAARQHLAYSSSHDATNFSTAQHSTAAAVAEVLNQQHGSSRCAVGRPAHNLSGCRTGLKKSKQGRQSAAELLLQLIFQQLWRQN